MSLLSIFIISIVINVIYGFFETEFHSVAQAGSRLYNLHFLDLRDSSASASQVAGTTGVRHHDWLIFVFLVEMGFHHVG